MKIYLQNDQVWFLTENLTTYDLTKIVINNFANVAVSLNNVALSHDDSLSLELNFLTNKLDNSIIESQNIKNYFERKGYVKKLKDNNQFKIGTNLLSQTSGTIN